MIKDWNDFDSLLRHTYYNELRIAPEENMSLFAVPPTITEKEVTMLIERFYEEYNVPYLSLMSMSYLSLRQENLRTGLAVMSGQFNTHVVPVYEASELKYWKRSNDIAGKVVTDVLKSLLNPKCNDINVSISEDIKEKHCFVSHNYENDLARRAREFQINYELPDGQMISLTRERFMAPEVIFNPKIIDNNSLPLAKLICETIEGVDIDIRSQIASNIVLSGGNTLFPGFVSRLEEDLKSQLSLPFKVIAKPNRKYSVYLGGLAVTKNTSEYMSNAVSLTEFQEYGTRFVKNYFSM